jgi:hypothetical protein
MIETFAVLLRVAGVMIVLLAVVHIPIAHRLKWREQASLLTPVNASIFRVHTFFVCLALVMMGLPCVADPSAFLERSRAGCWLVWSCSLWWTIRLFSQWFVFPMDLWRGKKFETIMHAVFSVLWLSLAILFAACGAWQAGWLH